jgi:hypothetical protein
MSRAMLCAALGKTPAQLNGILGPLGNRVKATSRDDMGADLGIGVLMTWDKVDGAWWYGLRPVAREVLLELYGEHPTEAPTV